MNICTYVISMLIKICISQVIKKPSWTGSAVSTNKEE